MKLFCLEVIAHGLGRSPHGERGLKLALDNVTEEYRIGRSPHGERGLK